MNFLALLSNPDSLLDFNLSASLPKALQTGSLRPESSAFRKVTAPEDSPSSTASDPSVQAILEQRQRLINQFLQLNIQMLEKEIEQQEGTVAAAHPENSSTRDRNDPLPAEAKAIQKKIKKANHCGHDERPHYAKGMCSNCYHRNGRSKKPWNCPHERLYAAGLCQNCYINQYNRKRREDREDRNEDREHKIDERTATGVEPTHTHAESPMEDHLQQ